MNFTHSHEIEERMKQMSEPNVATEIKCDLWNVMELSGSFVLRFAGTTLAVKLFTSVNERTITSDGALPNVFTDTTSAHSNYLQQYDFPSHCKFSELILNHLFLKFAKLRIKSKFHLFITLVFFH